MTQQEIQKSIDAAFDSVTLINELKGKELDAEQSNAYNRNVEHLKIMMAKQWFLDALTLDQITIINELI